MNFCFLRKDKFFLIPLLIGVLMGCQKPLSVPALNTKNFFVSWTVSESYRPPSFAEGPLKRVLTLKGSNVDQIYVDRQEEDGENWVQIGLTNDLGRFVDDDIDKRVRYRFGGKLITPWYESMKTLFLSPDMTLPAKIRGFHCLVPSQVTIYIENKNLEINCQYITILGNIYSFKNNAQRDSRGLNAGHVRLIAEEINIQGRIWLLGQNGGEGKSVSKGLYRLGYTGKSGGSGGEIFLEYQNLQEMYDSFRVEGGHAGNAGYGQKKERSTVTIDGQRGRVVRKKKYNSSSF